MSERKYTEVQLARLKDLLTQSHRALQIGTSYYDQANESAEFGKANCAKFDSAHAKLELVSRELTKQLQLIAHLVSQLRTRNSYLVSSLETLHSGDEEIIQAIADVFNKLREKQVDSNIAEGKTLYDYVDTDSVEALKAQALQEMQELKNIQFQSQRILQSIEGNYEKLAVSSRDSSLSVDYKPTFVTEKMSLQLNEIKSMSSILATVAAQYDRVNHLYTNRDKYADLSLVEHRTEHELPTLISKMFESLQRVKAISEEVDNRVQRYSIAFKNAVKLLTSLETFGLEAKNKLLDLGLLETSFEERKEGARFIFEELSNLATWYDLFYSAYTELIFEITRRHEEQKRHQEIVDNYQKDLHLLWKMESQKREHFHEYYGRYLPQSLCPAVMEPATRFQVFPEKQTTQLPTVTPVARPSLSQIDLAISDVSGATDSLALSPKTSRTPRGSSQN